MTKGTGTTSVAGRTSRFPQTPSTGPLRGRELQAASEGPDPSVAAGGTSRFPQAPSTGPLRGQAACAAGFTLWFTGLSGAGKTTIAELVRRQLERRGLLVEWLDGDEVREHLCKGLGFSKADRDTNIDRIGWVASKLTRHGASVIVSAISPYREARDKARAMVEEHGTFVEVFVDASVEECARRDVKGLYEKAFRGEIPEFTGVSDPYEAPTQPEIRIESEHEEPDQSAQRILALLEQRGLVPVPVPG
jgi:adenylylsulfate kinase